MRSQPPSSSTSRKSPDDDHYAAPQWPPVSYANSFYLCARFSSEICGHSEPSVYARATDGFTYVDYLPSGSVGDARRLVPGDQSVNARRTNCGRAPYARQRADHVRRPRVLARRVPAAAAVPGRPRWICSGEAYYLRFST